MPLRALESRPEQQRDQLARHPWWQFLPFLARLNPTPTRRKMAAWRTLYQQNEAKDDEDARS